MTDMPPRPLDYRRSDPKHEAIVARIVRLEVTAEYTEKTLDLMQRRMDDGFKQLTEAIGQLRNEMNASINQQRKERSPS